MKKALKDLLKKDQTSLVKIKSGSTNNSTTVILKNQTLDKDSGKLRSTFLGDVFNALPHGIINKTETGIGATTLELNTLRDSIIVEPLKITASSKAYKFTKKGQKCLYVGSETPYHPKRNRKNEILAYLQDSSILYKKIIVVADSLPQVINLIEKKKRKDFFLLLDDIDSFQEDSTFRTRMENCMDYFKDWNQEKRALASATIINFSDSSLKDEPITTFKYEKNKNDDVYIYKTDNLKELSIELIKYILKNEPGKIVVAYNSVEGNVKIAQDLVAKSICSKEDIGILCSNKDENKEKCGSYFAELKDSKLPNKICLMTSAYFLGFDIDEKFHAISLSDGNNSILMLSANIHKQIVGRCRKDSGVLSNIFIYKEKKKELDQVYTIEDLLTAGKKQLKSLECITSIYKDDIFLKNRLKEIRNDIFKLRGNAFTKFVRTQQDGEFAVSFFNIDAYFENQKTFLMHSSEKKVKEEFMKLGYNVKFKVFTTGKKEEYKRISSVEYKEAIGCAVGYINSFIFHISSEEKSEIKNPELVKEIIELYNSNETIITRSSFTKALEDRVTNKLSFNRFKKSFKFYTYLEENKLIKDKLCYYFPIDKSIRLKHEAIIKNWIDFITDTFSYYPINYNIKAREDLISKSKKHIMQEINTYIELKGSESCKDGTGSRNCKYVKSHNPYNLKVKSSVFSFK